MAATIYEPLSTAHLKSCTVDFDSRPDKKAVNLVQYDQTIPVLCVSLKKGGTEYKVPSDADVNIRMDKRDGYHVYNPALGVNAERTIAYFAVTPQMSTGWGDYYPIVEITVGGGVAGSAPIWLHFDRNPLPENAIISSDEYKTIQQLLEDVKAVKADTEAIKTATEQIKAQTEAVRDQAKGFADNAKNSADKAQTLVDGMPSDYSQAMKDIGTLKNQMQRAYPDDSTIGENTWSSKNIVDMLCPEIKESGNPVWCYPVAGYPLGVKASWEPTQEGTGTPYPAGGGKNQLNPAGYEAATKTINGITFTRSNTGEVVVNGTATGTAIYVLIKSFSYTLSLSTDRNWSIVGENVISAQGLVSGVTVIRQSDNTSLYIRVESGATVKATVQPQIEKGSTPTAWAPYENIRPIKGRDSVTVERCGENLLNIKPFNKFAKNGITFEYVADGGIHISGTALNNADGPTFPIWHLPPGKYYGLNFGVEILPSLVVKRNGGNYLISAKGPFEVLTGDICNYFYVLIKMGTTIDKTVYPYIVPGTTAPTTYTPYIGQSNTLTLPSTIYGGEVDAVSGEGQDTWKSVSLDGTEKWNTWGVNKHNTNVTGFFTYDINDYSNDGSDINKILCSTMSNEEKNIWGGKNMGVGFANSGNSKYLIYCVTTNTLPDTTDDKKAIASFKTFLANLYAAGTPVQVAYKLATQTPFTATGAQPMPALAGVNTVLTNADSATVTGRADPIKRITDLEDAVASQT